jgi:hypothetical protein
MKLQGQICAQEMPGKPPYRSNLSPQHIREIIVGISLRPGQVVAVSNHNSGRYRHKASVEIPDAAFEKLALLLRAPSPSLVSTWGPPVGALLVSIVALFGVYVGGE